MGEQFKARESEELVIGLVGPLGAGVSLVAEELKAKLEEEYKYQVSIIKVSDLIARIAGEAQAITALGIAQRFDRLQTLGNQMREKHGNAYLAQVSVGEIGLTRAYEDPEAETLVAKPQRVAHIIDSIKNPAEIDFLSAVYRDHYWTVAVLANEARRRARMRVRGFRRKHELDRAITRDAHEAEGHGQHVRDAVYRADYFLHNSGQGIESVEPKVARLLSRIFNTDIASLSADEMGMGCAHSAAMRSACLSRQVGAAVIAKNGEVAGIGWNDVPKFGGGLYGEEAPCSSDSSEDHRCFKMDGKLCHNSAHKRSLYDKISKQLADAGLLAPKTDISLVRDLLSKTEIKDIIEYSRSIHAEMEAILSAARSGRSVVGATLYTTVYPCHNCARHIVAAGITQVVYVEPYPKSLALGLHGDAITEDDDVEHKVLFRQYEGIAPASQDRIYPLREERKDATGVWSKTPPNRARPIIKSPLDSFIEREQFVIKRLREVGESDEQGQQAV